MPPRTLKLVEMRAEAEPSADQMGDLKFDQKFRELPREAGVLADGILAEAQKITREVRGTVFGHQMAKLRIKAVRAHLEALEAILCA